MIDYIQEKLLLEEGYTYKEIDEMCRRQEICEAQERGMWPEDLCPEMFEEEEEI